VRSTPLTAIDAMTLCPYKPGYITKRSVCPGAFHNRGAWAELLLEAC